MALVRSSIRGAVGGSLMGALLGLTEAMYYLATQGAADNLAPLYGIVLYGLIGSGVGIGGGFVGAFAPQKWRSDGLSFALGWSAAFVLIGGFALRYLANKIVYAEAGVDMMGHALLAAFLLMEVVGSLVVLPKLFDGERSAYAGVRGLAAGWGVLLAVGAGLLAMPTSSEPVEVSADAKSLADVPNTLTIMVDTLRADYVGAYGREGNPTPAIDAFAADAILFEQPVAGSSWTRPSGASLMTARLPSGHGAATKASRISDEVVTCAEVQQDAGVTTGALINNINMTTSFGFDQGFDMFVYESPEYPFGATESVFNLTWYKVVHKVREKLFGGAKRVEEFYQPAEVVFADAKDFIKAHEGKPWSLFVHLMEPHDPYFEHPYLRGEGDAEFNGVGFARAEVEHPKPEQADYLKEVYAQEIIHMDKRIADFFQWMKDEGLYDETWIAFTSDHGEEFNEHGGWWHGTTLYEEQIHVPLIVKLPGNELAGTRIPYAVQQFDACSTAVAAQGLPLHETWDGLDLMPNVREWVAGKEGSVEEDAADVAVDGEAAEEVAQAADPCAERLHPFARATIAEIDFEGNVVTAIRDDGYKVIQANEGNPRGLPTRVLYDLSVDPGELEDISGKSGQQCQEYYADIADRLQKELGDTLVAVKSGGASGDVGCVSDAEIQNLIALGYLDGDAAAELRAKCK